MPTPPTSTPWVPMWPVGGASIPPVTNGKWIKGVGGAMVWSDIDSDDILTGRLAGICKTITDWNAAVTNGWYKANAAANAPSAGAWYLGQVITHATDYVVQRVTDFTSGNISWYERRCIGGAWQPWKPQGMDYATSLPASAPDGTEAILVDSLTLPTYAWRFRYNAGSTSPYKWDFIGGAPRNISIATDETSAATGWTDLTTVGPNFTAPRAGDYYVSANALLYGTGSPNNSLNIGVTVGATTPANPCISQGIGATGQPANIGVPLALSGALLAGVPAGGDIRMRYEFSVVTGHALRRNLSVTPLRVA